MFITLVFMGERVRLHVLAPLCRSNTMEHSSDNLCWFLSLNCSEAHGKESFQCTHVFPASPPSWESDFYIRKNVCLAETCAAGLFFCLFDFLIFNFFGVFFSKGNSELIQSITKLTRVG